MYIFSMPRPELGYSPGDEVSDEFAATHPGMVSLAPVQTKPALRVSEEADSE
jgi:hypothetical protein